jgi:hypothetical protein
MAGKHPMAVCGAKLRKRDKTCQQVAGWGTGHPGVGRCRLHGGSSPQAEVAGQVEIARTDFRAIGQRLPSHPAEALLEMLSAAHAEFRYWQDEVTKLDSLVGQPLSTVEKSGSDGDNSGFHVYEERRAAHDAHIALKLMHEAQDRTAHLSALALKANIEEKRLRLAMTQAEDLASIMRQLVEELGHSADDPATRQIMRRVLTAPIAA